LVKSRASMALIAFGYVLIGLQPMSVINAKPNIDLL
jgi:hypothetical protein